MAYQQCANPSQYCGKRSTGTSRGFTNCRLKGFFVIPGWPPHTALWIVVCVPARVSSLKTYFSWVGA
ncbi:Uncharacterised protein [Mycobacteroides abscessus subsp. massiliense]|nr:Uncharacterised protein [Mycobacteroides abscessus subsp. massiliense]